MNKLENFQLVMRLLGTAALGVQLYAYGPSLGLALTQATVFFCIWFNRERQR